MNVPNQMQKPSAASARAIFPAIDVLRGVAATMVIVFHVIGLGQWAEFPQHGLLAVFRFGWVGVDLFFVISGFVIALAALYGFDREGRNFRRSFAIRRLARIVPLYLLSGMVFLFATKPELLAAPTAEWVVRVSTYVLFLQNLHPFWHGAINGPSWSVALEMQFYLFMLCVTPWLARVRSPMLLLVAFVFASLYRLGTTMVLPPGVSVVMDQYIYLSQLPGVIDQFAIGALLALGVRQGRGLLFAALVPCWRNCLAWGIAAAALLTVAALTFDPRNYWSSRILLVAWRPLLTLGLGALVACAITCPRPTSRWLAPARYAGTISYGLYLWHFPVLVAFTMRTPQIMGIHLLAQTLICTALLAALSWHFLEKPCIERFKPRTLAPRSPSPQESPQ